ncbi:hypothetical protein MARLIPOL_08144 [Marinobacter lipolyticus SM19]|uniref:Secreted protein n=1 Tax=Marinobacter lipolyticus SM19 TaxID=1318628 RepID=R8B293_9GAMM|nr:hypothetical protein [Marinobacter lipolyticus]EON92708.1 hypothetical protein MARLIPOL_08144 [Marinobacter lipolyticus SM19]
MLNRICLVALAGLTIMAGGQAVAGDAAANRSGDSPPVELRVEGITAHSADDDPGVLYILPWQPPTLPRRPRARLDDSAPDLLEPQDPMALERHRIFRETLNPSPDSYLSVQ